MTATELKSWRARLGWTQEKAASALGMTLSAYRWNETNGVRRETVRLLAARIAQDYQPKDHT
jgi:transcriptional regulator with XRE-family HTH domain